MKQMHTDGLRNVVAGLGTDRDKAAHSEFVFTPLTQYQIDSAYRASKILRKIVDMPAEDAGREWREWKASAEQISDIEAEEKRLRVQKTVIEALRLARLRGGSAIYIGTGGQNPAKPLNPETIKKGGVKFLTVFTRDQIVPGERETNPLEPGCGKPKRYTISAGKAASIIIHPSRLIIFKGDDVPEGALGVDEFWGDSVVNSVLAGVTRLTATADNVASLVFEAKVDVFKVPDLMTNLSAKGAAYEKTVMDRFRLATIGKGVNGTLLLDAAEDYVQKSASFSTLPDIIKTFMMLVSSESEMPPTLLFGRMASGLSDNGDDDTRAYYDRVKVFQTLDIEPEMSVFDECLIRSALGNRPEKIFFNWRPLWQLSEKDRAEIAVKIADAAQKVSKFIDEEAVGRAVTNAFAEVGAFPGLEGITSEMSERDDFGEDDLSAAAVGDAKPRTLYVMRSVLNGEEIIAWAKEQGFKTTLKAENLHVTIAYSRKALDWMKVGQPWESEIDVPAGGPRLMEKFGPAGEAKVLLFASSHLGWRHEDIKKAGATWDHGDYQPHITISYDPDAPDIEGIEPYRGEIKLGPEVFSEVDEGWKEKVSEQ